MRNLCRIINGISLGLSIAAAGTIAAWLLPGDYNHDLAALVNKRDLLASAPSPRLVYMGGSNLTTLRSRHMERLVRTRTGTSYTVVNMGLWGGLSMERYLDEIRPLLLPGDVIVLCQEYATLLDPTYFNYIRSNDEAKKYFFLMSRKHRAASFLSPRAIREALASIILLNQMKMKTYLQVVIDADFSHRFTGGYYRYRKEYNDHGDRVMPFRIIRPLNSAGARFQEPVDENIAYLGRFNDYARARNIRVVIMYPPFPEEEYKINANVLSILAERYVNRELETIGSPNDMVFQNDLFADTVYHLTPQGESARTRISGEQLIKALRRRR